MTAPVGARRLPAERRRRQLLSAALELFGARGYHAASMEEIAERAGVTKPVLYHHFPSKRELFLELVETVGDELLGAVASAAAAESAPPARLLAGFQAYFRFAGQHPAAFLLLFGAGARRSDELGASVRAVEDGIAGIVGGLVEVDVDQAHRELLGYAIAGLAEGAGRHWVERLQAQHPHAARDDHEVLAAEAELLARRLADLVWAGVRALPASRPRPATRGPAGP